MSYGTYYTIILYVEEYYFIIFIIDSRVDRRGMVPPAEQLLQVNIVS